MSSESMPGDLQKSKEIKAKLDNPYEQDNIDDILAFGGQELEKQKMEVKKVEEPHQS